MILHAECRAARGVSLTQPARCTVIPENELFNPKHYEGVRRPLLEAETMPAWCYTSPAFYRREVERIWRKVWNFVGSARQCPNPGDYFTLSFAGVPLIILRDREGTVACIREYLSPSRLAAA